MVASGLWFGTEEANEGVIAENDCGIGSPSRMRKREKSLMLTYDRHCC